jgi:hypothetical protein
VDIISEEEFLARAPPELKEFKTDHEKSINILKLELEERKRFVSYSLITT